MFQEASESDSLKSLPTRWCQTVSHHNRDCARLPGSNRTGIEIIYRSYVCATIINQHTVASIRFRLTIIIIPTRLVLARSSRAIQLTENEHSSSAPSPIRKGPQGAEQRPKLALDANDNQRSAKKHRPWPQTKETARDLRVRFNARSIQNDSAQKSAHQTVNVT